MKECRKCGVLKELELFPTKNVNKDGRAAQCKECSKRYSTPEAKANRRKQLKFARINCSCLICGKAFKVIAVRDWCNKECLKQLRYRRYIDDWKCGIETGNNTNGQIKTYLKRYLREKYNNACSQCGWAEVNPASGNVPIEVDHIDGDWRNNVEENLRLLCPNCHSLTITYGALNKRPAERTKQRMCRKQFAGSEVYHG